MKASSPPAADALMALAHPVSELMLEHVRLHDAQFTRMQRCEIMTRFSAMVAELSLGLVLDIFPREGRALAYRILLDGALREMERRADLVVETYNAAEARATASRSAPPHAAAPEADL